jgi:hypothetical protein
MKIEAEIENKGIYCGLSAKCYVMTGDDLLSGENLFKKSTKEKGFKF